MILNKVCLTLFLIVASLNGFANGVDSVFINAKQLLNSNFEAAISEVQRFNDNLKSYSRQEQQDFHHQAAQFYQMIGQFDKEAYHWQSEIDLIPTQYDTINKITYYLGRAYMNLASWDSALVQFEKFEKYVVKHKDTADAPAAYDGLATIMNYTGKKKAAIGYYLKAIRVLEISGSDQNLSQVYANMALVYDEMDASDDAFDARMKSYKLALSSQVEYAIHKSELGLATSYNDKNNTDSALVLLKNAEAYFEANFHIRFLNGVYNELGRTYFVQENFGVAEEYYKKSLGLLRSNSYDFALPGTLTNYAQLLNGMERFEEAVNACQEALPIVKSLNYLSVESEVCACLYANFKGINQVDSALFYFERHLILDDSLNNVEVQKAILEQELESSYFKEKENIISDANAEIDEQANLRKVWIIGCLILLVALIILFLAFRQKKKSNDLVHSEKKYLDNLLHNLVHEFRTPLTLIKGPTEELLKKDGNNELLQIVDKNSDQMLNLVNQVLDFAKIKAGRLAVANDIMNLSLFYADTLALFQPLAAEKKIQLINHSEIENPFVEGDTDKLFKVLSNLLTNAIKYSNEKAIVSLQSSLKDNSLVFSVHDTGIGISAEDQLNVFKKFYQVDATITRKGEGTGLGLAFVQELVHLMGGTIKLESELNLGTKVTVTVPVKALESADIDHSQRGNTNKPITKNEEPIAIETDSEKKQILIIEDNRDLQRFLKQILTDQGYQTHAALDGEMGIEKALEIIPDLVISDVMMPKMDGYQVVQKLKKTFATEHVPIIMLTAKASFDSMLDGLSAGADDYLSKPFKSQELQLRIANQLNRQEKLHAKYIEESKQEHEPEVKHALIEKIEAILTADLSDQISVEDLAHKCALSRSQLHRKVKFITGLSTTALLTAIRLNLSLADLKNVNLSISEIAYKYGYTDPAHYSKLFKKQFDQTPSEFRNSKH